MLIKVNTKGNFKTVPEGERVLEITKAECTPSGKPNKMKVTFTDSLGEGSINTQYDFTNDKSLYAMGKMLEVALDMSDGDDFDTKDCERLVGIKLLCEVVHTEGTKPNDRGELPIFANVKRVIERSDSSLQTLANEKIADSPRNLISNNMDDLD